MKQITVEGKPENYCYLCGEHTDWDCKGCDKPVCDECTVSTGNPNNPDFVYCTACASNINP